MKKLAFLTLLALAFAVSSCGNRTPTNVTNTQATGNWEAELTRLTGDTTGLSFVTAFSVTNSGPLDITGFGFINSGACFQTGKDNENLSGTASFTTGSTGQVTGQLTFTVNSINPPGNVLTLTSPPGGLTGTSNGTTTTTGTLSNGVVQGTWTLTPGSNTPDCTGTGNFLMCQGTATCTVP